MGERKYIETRLQSDEGFTIDTIEIGGAFMADFQFEIVEHIGVLSESPKGWTKELNKISWNGGAPKYDIRDWAPEHEKMGKGVTLSKEELEKLKELLKINSK